MSFPIFVRDEDFSWTAKEVVREVDDRPHLLLRIDVHGPHFPELDVGPFARIIARKESVPALMTEVGHDQRHVRAYFPTDVPMGRGAQIEVSYGRPVVTLPLTGERGTAAERLDDALVPGPVHRVRVDDLGAFAT